MSRKYLVPIDTPRLESASLGYIEVGAALDMTGNPIYDVDTISLGGTPTAPDHAATKGYVDTGLGGKSDTSHTHAGLAPALNIRDEGGAPITSAPTGLNFVGAGVTVAGSPEPTITIPGVPVGCVMMWAATAPPSDWLLCDGASYPNASYPALAAILRLTAAFVVDANNFRTPDLVRRVAVGSGVSLAVGRSDGIATQASRSFAHTHGAGTLIAQQNTAGNQKQVNAGTNSTTPTAAHPHDVGGSTASSTFDDIPNMCLAFIIKAEEV